MTRRLLCPGNGGRRLWPGLAVGWAAALLLAVSTNAAPECAECHRDLYERQVASRHANALRPYPGSKLAAALSSGPVSERNGYRFAYGPDFVTARKGDDAARGELLWAFGAGGFAMTALGRFEDRYFEHRISFYAVPNRPSFTPGHRLGASPNAKDALGIVQSQDEAYRCFHCHATGVERDASGGPELSAMIPGLQCERCHGAGARHTAAARAGRPAAEIRSAIFNSGRLAAKASTEVCGGCHRTPGPGPRTNVPELDNPLSVRFQPIGLMASRCFTESKALACTTCHDPHQDAVRNHPDFYREKCLACHAATPSWGPGCRRRGNEDCLPCHMERVTPVPYLTFTDHRIRVIE